MNFRDLEAVSPNNGSSFRVALSITVDDAQALWNAAADRALSAPGITIADVLDTIGPREDPAILECISMLTAPGCIPGCALESYQIDEVLVSRQAVRFLPIQAHCTPLLPAANG
jgi:hypothetical protein